MKLGLLVIGSELLSGKRRDAHLPHCIESLAERGLELDWCRYLADEPGLLTRELRFTMSTDDLVFSLGGIGATPDDHTRACAARAAGVGLERHPEAAALIEERFGAEAYPQRIHMADLPAGCTLVPNPVNRIPGFSMARHHFLPGFPQMAWPMMSWVLDNRYPELRGRRAPVESLVTVPGASEGVLIGVMRELVERFPDVRLSCLPHMEGEYRETELGLRGEPAAVDSALEWLVGELGRGGWAWERKR